MLSIHRFPIDYLLPATCVHMISFIAFGVILLLLLLPSSSLALSPDILVIKIGGSSITDKATKETLNSDALNWFASTLAAQVSPFYLKPSPSPHDDDNGKIDTEEEQDTCEIRKTAFVVVHGAGSFGHHTAKEFGLKGRAEPPLLEAGSTPVLRTETDQRFQMQGLSETRLSVQKLNQMVVASLVHHGMNAVAISPCFAVQGLQAHGGDAAVRERLQHLVKSTLDAGLIPVLHGDACLYGPAEAAILSGDVLVEMIGVAPWVHKAIFLTDVDGVYTKDPRSHPDAQILPMIAVNVQGDILEEDLDATGSSHQHDVTGGLKTKLLAATSIAASGKNVTIARSSSLSAEKAIRQESRVAPSTTIYLRRKANDSRATL